MTNATVWVYVLATRSAIGKSWGLTVLEVLDHAILAVSVIGWDSGFHYYILRVIPVAVISSVRPVGLKAALVVSVMITYLVLDMALRKEGPVKTLPPGVVNGLHYFNVVGVMLILTFLAGYYYLINKVAASLQEMASTDPMTQLRNPRATTEAIRCEVSRVHCGQPHLSYLCCAIWTTSRPSMTHAAMTRTTWSCAR